MNISYVAQSIIDALRPVEATREESLPAAAQNTVRPGSLPRSLEQILALNPHLPIQTAILGMCEDGYPVLFDLLDERPGPLLITGETGCGKTRLLKMIIKTAISLNSPYEVRYSLVTSNPDEWSEFSTPGGHCLAATPEYESAAGDNIIRLAEIASARRKGRQEGAAILLVVDDLRFINRVDADVRLNFEWLLKYGPAAGIWPVVSLSEQNALEMPRVVSQFHTRIIGKMSAASSKRLAIFDGLASENLETGKQFAVRVQDDWLSFWLPARI